MSALLERDSEVDRLRSLLADARAGQGRVVFIGGEAGIGKTSVVAELTRVAGHARVAVGRCDALATPRALGPFLDAAASLGVHVAGDRDGLLGALVDACRDATPTLLVIEDAHWADDATVELIAMLGRRVVDLALLMVVTYRDGEVTTDHPLRLVIGDLVTANATVWMGLRPLSLAAVRTLVAGRSISADTMHERTGGNPFYVTEALASPTDEVPTTVRLAVLARAARLDPVARAVLDAVAVVPGRAEHWLVDALCEPVPQALAACVSAGMLIDEAGHYAFRHELARLAVWAEMPDALRRALHARAVAVLARHEGIDPARVAHHADAAGDEAAVARWARDACTAAAAKTAHRETIRHGERALQASRFLDPDDVADLWIEVARSMIAVARSDEAEVLAQRAVDHWLGAGDVRREADALVVLSGAQAALGMTQASTVPIGRAIELLEQCPPGAELVNAYIRMTSAHMLARERDAAAGWGHKAIGLASDLGDPGLLGRALIETGIADVMDGRFEGLQLVRQAIDLGVRHDLPGVVCAALMQIGSGCGEMRRYDLAVPALLEAAEVGATHHIESPRQYSLAWLARCRFDLGQWDEVAGPSRDALTGRSSVTARFVALNTIGWLRARRGEADVWPALDEALDIARRVSHLQRSWPNAVARAEAGWLQGSLDPHVALLEESFELARRCRHGIALGELGLWLHRAGVMSAPPPDAAEPFACWIAGRHLEAAAGFRRMGCPYEAASALVDTGETGSMREAWATFERLGAVPMSTAVAASLAARGVSVSARPKGRARNTEPSALSDREVEVLRLVSAGFSNPQIAAALFISRKTAEHHVSNILAKLGASGRAEAAALAVRTGVLDNGGA